MAKAQLDECLFCGEVPCVCAGRSPKKAAPKPKVAKPTAPRSPMADRMRKAHEQQARTGPIAAPVVPVSGTARDRCTNDTPRNNRAGESQGRPVEELVLEDAIRNLAPLLSEDELKKHSMILTSSQTPSERAAVWRYRKAHS